MKQDNFMEALSRCPVCSSSDFILFIKCVDNMVSYETFQIVQCTTCGFKFTNPRPSIEVIGQYYQSSDYVSHSNTSKGIINKIYQVARYFTISKKVKLIKSLNSTEKNILDYGSGTGEFLMAMKEAGWKASGIEPDQKARSFAFKNQLEVSDPKGLKSFPAASFDIITLWHVLEHIHDLNETILLLRKLLTDRGKIVVAVPNNTSTDQEIYKEKWAAYDVPRHLYHFNFESINRLFQNHQMTVKRILPMPLDGFYVSLLSEKYKQSNVGLLRGFFSGLKGYLNSLKEKQFSSSLIFIIEKG